MFSFILSDDFVAPYYDVPPPFGYRDAGGNSLGEIAFIKNYSRKRDDGTKERWPDVCRRVVDGTWSILKDHAKANRLPWNDRKAQALAQEMFDRLFHLKWTPPGRGLWAMGTPLVMEHRNSAALQNCAFISTADMTKADPTYPFAFLMEASMLGIGVGFDTAGAEKGFTVHSPRWVIEDGGIGPVRYGIPDTREGWVDSVVLLLESYLKPNRYAVSFDYSAIRPAGSPIRTFGGTAAGPGPLRQLHEKLRAVLDREAGQPLSSRVIADIGNLIGVCVVSGNVRRSAELLLGDLTDSDFLRLKDPAAFPERNSYDADAPGWGWMSNNSVKAAVGDDLSVIAEGIALNGEPGVAWMDVTRAYGRLADAPTNRDWRAAGYNPCAEQSLESGECCTLVETYLNRHDNEADFHRTLKFAYLYAKAVTLLPTHWPRTNAIMQRNRRIGTSASGMANFADKHGLPELRRWLDHGYATVAHYDRSYSEWLCVRESIKTTTVKPSGTVSILAGESPGVHWTPGGAFFDRAMRFAKDDPLVARFATAGYRVEPASEDPAGTVVVFFPVRSDARRSEKDVSIYEKANLAALAQRYWSDNSVSVTVSFDRDREADDVGRVLAIYEGQLKTVSFLPMGDDTYPQMPYTQITADAYGDAELQLLRVDFDPVYAGDAADAAGEAYCTTDACEVRTITNG